MLTRVVASEPPVAVAFERRAAARASWVEIDTAALRHNLRLVRSLAGAARVYAVCKGGAYGFGAGWVARIAEEEGIDALACGDPDDARAIRAAGCTLPVLLYGTMQAESLPSLAPLDVTVTAHDAASLAACLDQSLAFSLKFDVGLHRLGFAEHELDGLVRTARAHPQARIKGVYTHLTDLDIAASVATQTMRFNAMAARLEDTPWRGRERMVASSRVLLRSRSLAFDAVNPGRLVYGLLEAPWHEGIDCRSVLSAVKARIVALRTVPVAGAAPQRIAVIPFGFCDGYPRQPAGGTVLVRGQRVPIIGQRHSEHMMLDVTDVRDVALGDEAVLHGAQGAERIGMHELAAATGMPLIEFMPRLAAVPRRVILPHLPTGGALPPNLEGDLDERR